MEAHRRRNVIEDASGEDDLGGVSTTDDDAGHDRNANVLLDVERAGIERPNITEGFVTRSWKNSRECFTARERNQLGNNTRKVDRRD